MNIFISHSSKDAVLFDLIRLKLKEQQFHVPEKRQGLQWYSAIISGNKQKIKRCDLGIVLFSPRGKGSYLVHQEAAYLNMLCKNHFILESNGAEYRLTERNFENEIPAAQNESFQEEKLMVKTVLEKISLTIHHESHKMIFHTSMVFE
ncbi:MAG: hypothetical protein ABIO46_00915 [Chitinophagales bacterium]